MEKFDYNEALAELERIARAVEDPETALDDIDRYILRAEKLIESCREYLRTIDTNTDHII